MHAVSTAVAAVAEAAGIVRRVGHIALEMGARQVVKQHFVASVEEVGPAFAQVGEKGVFVLKQAVVAVVECIILGDARVHSEQSDKAVESNQWRCRRHAEPGEISR